MSRPIRGPSRPNSTAPATIPTHSTSRHGPTSLGGAYTGLLRGAQLLFSLLQPQSQATTVDILSQISSVLAGISDLKKRLREADPDEINLDEGKWQDRLDGEGTQLWNQSTIRKYRQVEAEDGGVGEAGLKAKEKDSEDIIVAKRESPQPMPDSRSNQLVAHRFWPHLIQFASLGTSSSTSELSIWPTRKVSPSYPTSPLG